MVAGSTGDTEEPEKEPGRVTARTTPAECRTIASTVYGLGRCEAPPGRIASLTPCVEGKVAAILAKPGDMVARGQKIVEFDTAIARAAFAEKTAARDEAVAAQRLLVSLPRPEEQAAARVAVKSAEVAVQAAQLVVDRLRPLRANNEIPKARMDEAELALKQALLQQQTSEAQLTVLMLKPRPQAIEDGEAKIAIAEAAVASAKALLERQCIESPVAGVLDSLTCRLGQTLSSGSPVGEVVNSRQINVVVWLPVPDVRRIRLGQTATIDLGGGTAAGVKAPSPLASLRPTELSRSERRQRTELPRSEGRQREDTADPTMAGRVTAIGRIADAQTGNLSVRISVDNSANRLTVGQIAAALITVNEKKNALAVPVEAIHDGGEEGEGAV